MARRNAAHQHAHPEAQCICRERAPVDHTRALITPTHSHTLTHTIEQLVLPGADLRVAKTPRTQVSTCSPSPSTRTQAACCSRWLVPPSAHMFRSRQLQAGVYGAATQDASAWPRLSSTLVGTRRRLPVPMEPASGHTWASASSQASALADAFSTHAGQCHCPSGTESSGGDRQ